MSDGTGTPRPESAAAGPAGTDAAATAAATSAVHPPDPALATITAPPLPTTSTRVDRPIALGFLITLGGLIAIALGVAFSNLSTIVIYVVFALFAALGLDPVVQILERHNVKRAWGIVITYTVFALLLIGVLWLIVPTVVTQIGEFISGVPEMISDFQASDFYNWIQANVGDQLGAALDELRTYVTTPSNIAAIGGGILRIGFSIATTISGIIIILVLSLYFLAGLPAIKVAFNRLAPARSRAFVGGMTDEITGSIGGYLMGMVILALCNSVVAFILHLSLGLPFPMLMAVAAFCITLIPLIGSVLFWIAASVLALFTSPVSALIFAVVYLVYMQLEAYLLTPRVMNKTISVPGALVVIGALVGGTLLGLLGALVAIPVTASILLIVKQVFIPRQDAKV
ncbi:AI-2E family transporter [Microbacterium sp. BWT-B31]|uniref:AI-2E family transporter n=1 Tax=Microbacterium sp. BWT-B31 TaxID=3232072 RepID=UPI003528757E